jgi:hypothetical protein
LNLLEDRKTGHFCFAEAERLKLGQAHAHQSTQTFSSEQYFLGATWPGARQHGLDNLGVRE